MTDGENWKTKIGPVAKAEIFRSKEIAWQAWGKRTDELDKAEIHNKENCVVQFHQFFELHKIFSDFIELN